MIRNLFRCILVFGLGAACAATPNRPNVVVILADDMGRDSVAAFNDKLGLPTPHLDQLAAEGTSFMDAHSSSAVCSPTRYGILTGRYNWRSSLKSGIVGLWKPPLIEADRLTIGALCQSLDYHTACIGKWHLGWHWKNKSGANTTNGNQVDFSQPTSGGPVDRGFHHYYGDDVPNWPPYVWINDHKTVGIPSVQKPKTMFGTPGLMMPDWSLEAVLPEISRRSAEYVRTQAANKRPFFLFFPLTSPHAPIAPSAAFKGKSGISEYADFLMETDWAVGQVLQAIREAGVEDNTLVIFTADNGTSPKAHFEELEAKGVHLRHHFRGNKADIFEGGHRVPFIVKWPGKVRANARSQETVCSTDIMRTVADAIGAELPDNAAEDSYSLLPIATGKAESLSREYVVHHSISGHFAIRSGSWKLIFAQGSAGWSAPNERAAIKAKLPNRQLYNLADDPKEQNNLYEQHPERIAEMTKALRSLVENGRSTPGPNLPNHNNKTWWPGLPWPNK